MLANMNNDVLMSITPSAAAAFALGDKTAELRRRRLTLPPGGRVWFYVTRPVMRVSLIARIDEVVEGSHRLLWEKYRRELAVERADFERYLFGTVYGCVIRLRGVKTLRDPPDLFTLRERDPSFHPPQVARRLLPDSVLLKLLQTAL